MSETEITIRVAEAETRIEPSPASSKPSPGKQTASPPFRSSCGRWLLLPEGLLIAASVATLANS
jgi:hypothetical protein